MAYVTWETACLNTREPREARLELIALEEKDR